MSSSLLKPNTNDSEWIVHNPKDSKSFNAFRDEMSAKDGLVGPSNQARLVEKVRKTEAFFDMLSSQKILNLWQVLL